MRDVCVLATIFPANLPYFPSFLSSLEKQSDRNVKLLLANDGVDQLSVNTTIPYDVIPVTGNPLAVRIQLMQEAVNMGYQKLIFGDTDDEFSLNRVEVVSELLDRFPVVCNDLDIMNTAGKITAAGYWGARLPEEAIINSSFLADKNCVGFGSVALTADTFAQLRAFKPAEVLAPDWYYFYLLSQICPIAFTGNCATHYRQHANNTIGLGRITADRIIFSVKVKLAHYAAISDAGFPQVVEAENTRQLSQRISDNPAIVEVALEKLKNANINYFWWEETNFLNGAN